MAHILQILRRPSRIPISLKEIVQELHSQETGKVESCLLNLARQGLVEVVYTSGYEVGLRTKEYQVLALRH
jgi:hypothetical protein